ncbi:hypothetical protein VTJ04DRAFT_2720 [Mycothermus thermophilus]|uniref:uncharacterized protein n=1 Tax=Humicola insolens TaxID=85995 RepID=UPI0037424931
MAPICPYADEMQLSKQACSWSGLAAKRNSTLFRNPRQRPWRLCVIMKDLVDLKTGDTFVVVDCGGGTADPISYELSTEHRIGGLCGAVFVDEAFANLLMSKLGKEAWNQMDPYIRQRMLQVDWEQGVKQTFDGKDRKWVIDASSGSINQTTLAPKSPWKKLTRVELTGDEVRGVFDTVVTKIGEMVLEQIKGVTSQKKTQPKYVILVGGCGRSKYLYNALKKIVDPDIEILQSRGPGPYGVCYNAHWDSSKHDERDKTWHEDEQAWLADNQMQWSLKIRTKDNHWYDQSDLYFLILNPSIPISIR